MCLSRCAHSWREHCLGAMLALQTLDSRLSVRMYARALVHGVKVGGMLAYIGLRVGGLRWR